MTRAGPTPRSCPCGADPEVKDFAARPGFGPCGQVGCLSCGRCTFRHEEVPPMSARTRAILVWNNLVEQHAAGFLWRKPVGPWRYRGAAEKSEEPRS